MNRNNITVLNDVGNSASLPLNLTIINAFVTIVTYIKNAQYWWINIPLIIITGTLYINEKKKQNIIKKLENKSPSYIFNLVDSESTNVQVNNDPIIAYTLDNGVDVLIANIPTEPSFYEEFINGHKTLENIIEIPVHTLKDEFYVLRSDILDKMNDTIKEYKKAIRNANLEVNNEKNRNN